jgi:hypothetical protein
MTQTTQSSALTPNSYICIECNASFEAGSHELTCDLNDWRCNQGHQVVSVAAIRRLPTRVFWFFTFFTTLMAWLAVVSLIFGITPGRSLEPHPDNPVTILVVFGAFVVIVFTSISHLTKGIRWRERGGMAEPLAVYYTRAGIAPWLALPLGLILAVQPVPAVMVFLGYVIWSLGASLSKRTSQGD